MNTKSGSGLESCHFLQNSNHPQMILWKKATQAGYPGTKSGLTQ